MEKFPQSSAPPLDSRKLSHKITEIAAGEAHTLVLTVDQVFLFVSLQRMGGFILGVEECLAGSAPDRSSTSYFQSELNLGLHRLKLWLLPLGLITVSRLQGGLFFINYLLYFAVM
nr:ultraviolet-B receptor UVR8 [Ipomoea batatas]